MRQNNEQKHKIAIPIKLGANAQLQPELSGSEKSIKKASYKEEDMYTYGIKT